MWRNYRYLVRDMETFVQFQPDEKSNHTLDNISASLPVSQNCFSFAMLINQCDSILGIKVAFIWHWPEPRMEHGSPDLSTNDFHMHF